MNASGGTVMRKGAGSSVASASYDDVKAVVTVSVTNKGDAPVLAEVKDGTGSTIARFKFPPGAGKVDRAAKGVASVDFRCDQGVKCVFDYALSVQ